MDSCIAGETTSLMATRAAALWGALAAMAMKFELPTVPVSKMNERVDSGS